MEVCRRRTLVELEVSITIPLCAGRGKLPAKRGKVFCEWNEGVGGNFGGDRLTGGGPVGVGQVRGFPRLRIETWGTRWVRGFPRLRIETWGTRWVRGFPRLKIETWGTRWVRGFPRLRIETWGTRWVRFTSSLVHCSLPTVHFFTCSLLFSESSSTSGSCNPSAGIRPACPAW
jgi:hypothetical protein